MTKIQMNTTLDDHLSLKEYLAHIFCIRGFWFTFPDYRENNDITVFASAFNGKEIVFLNDQVVSNKRNLKITSAHEFKFANQEYRVVYKVKNLLTGRVSCQLFIEDQLIDEQETALYIKNGKPAWGSMLITYTAGLLTGAVIGATIVEIISLF